MIKQLIIDIANEKISLQQALTRSKIIASKVKNSAFKNWIKKETEGYDDSDNIPNYRIIPSPCFLIAEFDFGGKQVIEVEISDKYGEDIVNRTYFHRAAGPINTIIENIESIDGPSGNINLSSRQVDLYSRLYKADVNFIIRSGYRTIGKVHLKNIIELTKQKLLDILMDLDEQFPDLENDFEDTKSNADTITNIITNNIHAPNNNLNNAVGSNNSIVSHFSNTLSESQEKTLQDLGVNQEEIGKLKTILMEYNKKDSTFGKKLMVWSAGVASSLAGRGLYDAIPEINKFITQLM